jgi:hypothetical protein
VGYRDGVGGAYCGTVTTPQGEGDRLDVIVMAATDGHVTAVQSIVTEDCHKVDGPATSEDLKLAESVLNTVRWPGER